jgi:HPt (histidine-containing phosphotransfer) domain-containing protein
VKAAWVANDLEETEAAAHALAGAAAAVGAGALERAARRMCDSPEELYMAELASVAERTAAALTTWCADFAPFSNAAS